jgi:hypothetical protein
MFFVLALFNRGVVVTAFSNSGAIYVLIGFVNHVMFVAELTCFFMEHKML